MVMFKKVGGWLAAIAVVVGGWFVVKPNDPPPAPVGFPVEILREKSEPGAMAPLWGVSVRDPLNQDINGLTVDQGPLRERWLLLPKSFYRHTAGSQSYKITSTEDASMQYALITVVPDLAIQQDFTWPPQLASNKVMEWVSPFTGRISLGNEPPIHVGPGKEFADPADYVNWAASVYQANPALQDKFYVQSGKPEIVNAAGSPNALKQKHLQVQTALQAAIASGRLPARIITTHKLLPDYGVENWYQFYGDLLNSYKLTYGPDVRVCFQEWNWAEAEQINQDVLLAVATFPLVMSRLRYEQGVIVDGAAYHQGSSVKPTAIIGLDESGKWAVTPLTELWEDFGQFIVSGQYVETVSDRPVLVSLEVFERAGTRYALFSNRSDSAYDVALSGKRFTSLFCDVGRLSDQPFYGKLPAKSCGVIEL